MENEPLEKPETAREGTPASASSGCSPTLTELEKKLAQQAHAGDVDGFHETLREIEHVKDTARLKALGIVDGYFIKL